MLTTCDVRSASDAICWLAGPNAWLDIGRTLMADVKHNPAISVLALGLLALLIYWQVRLHARIQEIGEKAARGSCYHFLPTLEVSLLTVLMASL